MSVQWNVQWLSDKLKVAQCQKNLLGPNHDHSRKGDLEAETKLDTVREIDQELSEIDTGHEQVEIGSKPRGDKIMLKLRGVMEKASKLQGTATLSGHVQAMCENKVVNDHNEKGGIEGQVKNWNEVVLTPQSKTPKRWWGFSDLDPPTPDEEHMHSKHKKHGKHR
ncbi:hypothetical protein BKA83DRAFT_4130488 [Pisolithus microcarpus]|nr:hypothetical protein BKA83DRAFT_4130488 [Pisolithus microcarpus]